MAHRIPTTTARIAAQPTPAITTPESCGCPSYSGVRGVCASDSDRVNAYQLLFDLTYFGTRPVVVCCLRAAHIVSRRLLAWIQ